MTGARTSAAGQITAAPIVTARAAQRAPVRAALRDATHEVHMRMHRLKPFRAILEARLPLQEYLGLLQSLGVYHSAIVTVAAQFGLSHLSSGVRRIPLLQADLLSLGGSELRQAVEWKPGSAEEVLGALYAAEGSILGGRVIAGQLDYLLGSYSTGRSFFVGSPDDGASWRNLLAVVEASCASAADLKRATMGALLGFELFEHCVTSSCFRRPCGRL